MTRSQSGCSQAFHSPRRRTLAMSTPIMLSVCWAGLSRSASGVQYEKYVTDRDSGEASHGDAPLSNSRKCRLASAPSDIAFSRMERIPRSRLCRRALFSSAGGLLTTATDLGKYVAFHLSAWPPRDDAETGPVRRSSVREMSHMWTPSNLTASVSGGKLEAVEAGYGYGLRISTDCRFEHIVGHGGGLPGFGSYMMWLPDYGVGMFAMANLTYSGPSEPISQALDVMLKSGGLRRARASALAHAGASARTYFPSLEIVGRRGGEANRLHESVPGRTRGPAARGNRETERARSANAPSQVQCGLENWLRGQFNLTCAKGTVGVFFSMSPTQPPAVQHLAFQKIASNAVLLGAPTGPPAGVACSE